MDWVCCFLSNPSPKKNIRQGRAWNAARLPKHNSSNAWLQFEQELYWEHDEVEWSCPGDEYDDCFYRDDHGECEWGDDPDLQNDEWHSHMAESRRTLSVRFGTFQAVAPVSTMLVGRIIGKGGSHIQELRSVKDMHNVVLEEKLQAHQLTLTALTEEALRTGIDMVQEFVGIPLSFEITRPGTSCSAAPGSSFNNKFTDFPPIKRK